MNGQLRLTIIISLSLLLPFHHTLIFNFHFQKSRRWLIITRFISCSKRIRMDANRPKLGYCGARTRITITVPTATAGDVIWTGIFLSSGVRSNIERLQFIHYFIQRYSFYCWYIYRWSWILWEWMQHGISWSESWIRAWNSGRLELHDSNLSTESTRRWSGGQRSCSWWCHGCGHWRTFVSPFYLCSLIRHFIYIIVLLRWIPTLFLFCSLQVWWPCALPLGIYGEDMHFWPLYFVWLIDNEPFITDGCLSLYHNGRRLYQETMISLSPLAENLPSLMIMSPKQLLGCT